MTTTHRERLLDRALRRDDGDALDVEPVLPRACERKPPLRRITRELERREEERVPLDGVVAERARVHRD